MSTLRTASYHDSRLDLSSRYAGSDSVILEEYPTYTIAYDFKDRCIRHQNRDESTIDTLHYAIFSTQEVHSVLFERYEQARKRWKNELCRVFRKIETEIVWALKEATKEGIFVERMTSFCAIFLGIPTKPLVEAAQQCYRSAQRSSTEYDLAVAVFSQEIKDLARINVFRFEEAK